MQASDIGVANKDLWMLANQFVIDMRQQRNAARTASGSPHGLDLRVGKHGVQIVQALCNRAGVAAAACQHMLAKFDFHSKIFKVAHGFVDAVLLQIAARRDQAHDIAFLQAGRFDEDAPLDRILDRGGGGREQGSSQRQRSTFGQVAATQWIEVV